MPRVTPTLHPRSRFTSSLFATTVFASFFVVVLPHVVPCPAPRGAFLDDGSSPATNGRRRRKKVITETETVAQEGPGSVAIPSAAGDKMYHGFVSQVKAVNVDNDAGDRDGSRRIPRECPIPKPGGLVGEILGFKKLSPGGVTGADEVVEQQARLEGGQRSRDGLDGRPP